jgi:hypothetical protein
MQLKLAQISPWRFVAMTTLVGLLFIRIMLFFDNKPGRGRTSLQGLAMTSLRAWQMDEDGKKAVNCTKSCKNMNFFYEIWALVRSSLDDKARYVVIFKA